jgi:hypothetical protein
MRPHYCVLKMNTADFEVVERVHLYPDDLEPEEEEKREEKTKKGDKSTPGVGDK